MADLEYQREDFPGQYLYADIPHLLHGMRAVQEARIVAGTYAGTTTVTLKPRTRHLGVTLDAPTGGRPYTYEYYRKIVEELVSAIHAQDPRPRRDSRALADPFMQQDCHGRWTYEHNHGAPLWERAHDEHGVLLDQFIRALPPLLGETLAGTIQYEDHSASEFTLQRSVRRTFPGITRRRDQAMMTLRLTHGVSLERLAARYDLTPERVRQIEARALRGLRSLGYDHRRPIALPA